MTKTSTAEATATDCLVAAPKPEPRRQTAGKKKAASQDAAFLIGTDGWGSELVEHIDAISAGLAVGAA